MTRGQGHQVSAASMLELAHRALGTLFVATTAEAFAAASRELLAAVEEAVHLIALPPSVRDPSSGLLDELDLLKRHTLLRDLALDTRTGLPAVYVTPSPGPNAAARLDSSPRPKPGDFYFEHIDKRPAIELCIELLARTDRVIDRSRNVGVVNALA